MKIEGLSVGYRQKIIVRDMELEIKKGEIISLIGPNGGGKSTVLKSISGQLKPIEGTVFLDGRKLSDFSLKELASRVSIMTTERISPQRMTCKDVVLSGRLPYSNGFAMYSETDKSEADSAIQLMKIGDFADMPYENLSDGQRQRTLISRAICQSPEYLIMDEPTSYLDIRYRMELMSVIKELSAKKVTVIMSLHELELALMVSDRVLMINEDGSAVCDTPRHILEKDLVKPLFGLEDEYYTRVREQLEGYVNDAKRADTAMRHSAFFQNCECEYFPCHDLCEERFNCLFCYCPLYDMEDCGGTYSMTEKGVKTCINCTLPHDRDNYTLVIKKLKEKMYGTGTDKKI